MLHIWKVAWFWFAYISAPPLGGYGKWVKSKSKCAPPGGVQRTIPSHLEPKFGHLLEKNPWTLKNKERSFFALKMLIFIHCIQTYFVLEAWNFEQSLSYYNQGHLPSLGGSPTNPRKVTNQPKDGHPKKRRKCTTDMEFSTYKLLTKLTQGDNCHGWSPTILKMVTYHP